MSRRQDEEERTRVVAHAAEKNRGQRAAAEQLGARINSGRAMTGSSRAAAGSNKAMNLSARRAALEFGAVDADTFSRLLRRVGSSEETAGAIKSQYAKELMAGDPSVGTLGFFACGRLVGALSFGRVPEVLEPTHVSGRIDVVLTEPDCRRAGIASILISKLIGDLDEELGPRLSNLSVLALHPAIVRVVERFGFTALAHGDTPLYSLRLEADKRAKCLESARGTLNAGLTRLRGQCVRCQRHLWVTPWCEPT